MIDQLVVLVGAGASYASAWDNHNEQWRPPLVTELFAPRPEFAAILRKYPDVQTLAPDLRAATRGSSAIGLETYLRDHVRDSTLAYDRRRYRAIPLYLQEVFDEVGQHFTPHPTNYDRLINAAFRVAEEILFITLNYDTLLDSRLTLHTRINGLSDYTDACEKWSLYKLHGSVDWVRPMIDTGFPRGGSFINHLAAMEDGDAFELGEISLNRNSLDSRRRIGGPAATTWLYPALSVPLGSEDELNCPPEHVEHLRARLDGRELHVLSVGYSGLDSSVLRILGESSAGLASLLAVNAGAVTSLAAATQIAAAFGEGGDASMVSERDFNSFVDDTTMADYLESLS